MKITKKMMSSVDRPIKEIKPLGNRVLTTMFLYEEFKKIGATGLIDPTKKTGTLKPDQVVLAVGPIARGVKVGDVVHINPERYATKKYDENSIKGDLSEMNPVLRYTFPQIEVDGHQCLLLSDNDFEYIINPAKEVNETL